MMGKKYNILAIESSCDDTSVAVIRDSEVLSNVISSQHFHEKYHGIVPELASRAHIKLISHVVDDALQQAKMNIDDIAALAVTSEPGLIGSLIVGSNFAKGLSLKYDLPLIPVNHIEGHVFSGNLQHEKLEFPYVALVVSGGHTALFYVDSFSSYKILGLTRDDAAGETFDKTATLMGLGYPGGPIIDRLAEKGNPEAYSFPRSMIDSGDYDFSYSGLKTAVRYFIHREFPEGVPEEKLPDICASLQAAIVDVLVKKTIDAAVEYKVKSVEIAGGVSANSDLRKKMHDASLTHGLAMIAPQLSYCMDNAAMIGYIAEKRLYESGPEAFKDLTFTVNPSALRAKKKKN